MPGSSLITSCALFLGTLGTPLPPGSAHLSPAAIQTAARNKLADHLFIELRYRYERGDIPYVKGSPAENALWLLQYWDSQALRNLLQQFPSIRSYEGLLDFIQTSYSLDQPPGEISSPEFSRQDVYALYQAILFAIDAWWGTRYTVLEHIEGNKLPRVSQPAK